MSTFTENYNLIKPDANDYYDIQDFNENMDAIDALMAEQETAAEQINEKIGTPADVGSSTVFGLLKNGGSIIKSIQRIVHSEDCNGTVTKAINPINTNKTIVLFERLHDGIDYLRKVDYTLNSDSLILKNMQINVSNPASFGFWIIEFN